MASHLTRQPQPKQTQKKHKHTRAILPSASSTAVANLLARGIHKLCVVAVVTAGVPRNRNRVTA